LTGGAIGVESVEGTGSTFWCKVRFGKSEAVVEDRVEPGTLDGLRMLYVDDNATNRRVFLRQVADWGVLSHTAVDGPSGIEMMQRAHAAGEPYGMVVLDMLMPGMDGLMVAEAIRRDPHLERTPLLMLTSFVDRVSAEGARKLGIFRCLTKPVRQSQLFDALVLHASMCGTKSTSGTKSVAESLHDVVESRADVESDAIERRGEVILVAEDNPVNQKVMERMLSKLGYRCDMVSDGRQAVAAHKRSPYAMILMDCQMPELDGFGATAAIRAMEGSARHTPIVAITASAMSGDKERCIEAGMDAYVSKPISSKALAGTLTRILGERSTSVVQ
jgi:CheY-like chemotaxis protein